MCGDWGKAAGRHDSQAEGQQLEGGRELWTSNTDWEKMNEEKTKSPPRHIDAVRQNYNSPLRWNQA